MKICITGALGHIGSKVIREIPASFRNSEIVILDNLSTQRYCSLFNLPDGARYRFIEADVLNADLSAIFKEANVVLHLAAITDAAGSFKNKEQVENVNYNTTVKVAEACCDIKCPMIYISSTSVYGTQSKIVDEDCSPAELQPQSPYAATKLREERFLQSLGTSGKLRFVICRFGTICGVSPGMRFHTAVNKFCWQSVMGRPITVWRTALNQQRPYLALSDAVNAIKFIINKRLFNRNIYNVLTANLTVNDVIGFIKRRIPQLEVEYVDTEIMNQLSYEVMNELFRKQGFKYMGSIENNVGETIELLKQAGKYSAP